jgi:hypothetical protein
MLVYFRPRFFMFSLLSISLSTAAITQYLCVRFNHRETGDVTADKSLRVTKFNASFPSSPYDLASHNRPHPVKT